MNEMENLIARDNGFLFCQRTKIKYRTKESEEYITEFQNILSNEIEIAKKRIKETINPETETQPKIDSLFLAVCAEFMVDADRLMSGSRRGRLVDARHLVRWLLFKGYAGVSLSLENISLFTVDIRKKVDHVTVIHSIGVIENLIVTDKRFKDRVDRCIETIKP